MDALDDDAVPVLHFGDFSGSRRRFQDIFIRDLVLLCLPVIFIQQPVDDLTLFQSTVSDGSQQRIPVFAAVSGQDRSLIFRIEDLRIINALGLHVFFYQFLAPGDVLFLQGGTEPLVDFLFCSRALDDIEPVHTWPLGVLGCDDLDPVSVLDLIIDRNDLIIHAGTDHLIADCGMNAVGEVDRGGSGRQVLHVTFRREAENTVGEQIQIALQEFHELLVVAHLVLPVEDLP